MTDITQQTLASIVSDNYHAVPLLEKHQLDFCCKGKRTLAEACREKGIDAGPIARELESIAREPGHRMPFTEMSTAQLINYIEVNHHYYIKQSLPVIYTHLERVALKHGDRFPYMVKALHLFSELQDEMISHLLKEETVVFPYIAEAEKLAAAPQACNVVQDISKPLSVLEAEHEQAGELMQAIRHITDGYTPPPGACTTFRVTMEELKAFEEDLHRHVYLENHVLFPRAGRFAAEV